MSDRRFTQASEDFRWASTVASFGMVLRSSEFKGIATYDSVLQLAGAAQGKDAHGYRTEMIDLIKRAKVFSTP